MKIYTKRGDTGDTDSMRGCRMSKSSPESKAIGSIDELKTNISQALVSVKRQNFNRAFTRTFVFGFLFALSILACTFLATYQMYLLSLFVGIVNMNYLVGLGAEQNNKNSMDDFSESTLVSIMIELHQISSMISNSKNTKIRISERAIEDLEELIDVLDGQLGSLSNFILHFNNTVAVDVDVCRAVCRRAERDVVVIRDDIDEIVIRYINRLSDALFMISRHLDRHYSDVYVSAEIYTVDETTDGESDGETTDGKSDDETTDGKMSNETTDGEFTDEESSSDEATPEGLIDINDIGEIDCNCDGECSFGNCACECDNDHQH